MALVCKIVQIQNPGCGCLQIRKIRINQILVKASSVVNIGDLVELKRKGFTFTFKVEKLIKTRVSAVLAAPCYNNLTPEEELNKYKTGL